VGGDPRYARPTDPDAEPHSLARDLHDREMLRNGITTFMGSAASSACRRRCSARSTGSACRVSRRRYDSGRWVGDEKGGSSASWTRRRAWKEFESAMAFIRKVDGSVQGPWWTPRSREVETCSSIFCARTRKAADELRLPIVPTAAYNIIEFLRDRAEHRMTRWS